MLPWDAGDPCSWALAQVHDLGQPARRAHGGADDEEPDRPPVEVNGSVGRVVDVAGVDGEYIVHLLEDVRVSVPGQHLREYTPATPELGGFDVAGPCCDRDLHEVAWSVSAPLRRRGWCVLQLCASSDRRANAVARAKRLTNFSSLRKELLTDYLGHGGSGKTAFLPPLSTEAAMMPTDDLSFFDQQLTLMAEIFEAISWDILGFIYGGRTETMVWTPYSSPKEEGALRPEPLSSDDIEEGLLEEHLLFLRRRKLCVMLCLHSEGGHITLVAKPGSAVEPVILPLEPGRLVVFRADSWTFRHEPVGYSVVLQTWVLEEKKEVEIQRLQGDVQSKAEAMGVAQGRAHPDGDRVHVMATWTRLPGGGIGPECYWTGLLEGVDAGCGIPVARWDLDIYHTQEGEPHMPGKAYSRHGNFLGHEDVYSFDHAFFGISFEEASWMAPGQRIVLEDGFTVLAKGGYTQESLRGRRVGFFLGDTGSDWSMFVPVEHHLTAPDGATVTTYGNDPRALSGALSSVTNSRLSHIFGLTGPTASADTACSSSLVAAGAAMQYLRPRALQPGGIDTSGRLAESVAGGISTQIGPGSYIGMCALKMISPQGRCFTFDESGDGYARGEGLSLMYLKASDEDEDRFQQASCLMGCCVNQDGRSASMTAPNGPSQQACIKQSMLEAGLEARMINLAECHGTGTALGDPIEVGALRNAMEPRDFALCLTSSKSNIGHLEGGAGGAGLLKCIVMLISGTCPPNCHLRQLNPHLDVAGFPCFFDTEGIDTNLNSALTGVSSFGFGGTNGRCDIWGQARKGIHKSGTVKLEELDQISVTCPITLGPIDHISGEPLRRPSGRRQKIRADVLREEFAPYDISRYAYTGGFRYAPRNLEEEDETSELDEHASLYVCGSWSGWTEMEEMSREADGWFSATFVLGETRCELFDICLNELESLRIYPASHKASSKICIQGPDDQSNGRKWMVDGRDMEIAAGAVFKIHFKWNLERFRIFWEQAEEQDASTSLDFAHTYYVAGGFSKWKCVALTMDGATAEGAWAGIFKVGSQGKEEFQFVRDKDWKQVIYPATGGLNQKGAVRACGPDDLAGERRFCVRGKPGSLVRLRLVVADAHVVVSASMEVAGSEELTTVWESLEGWERHSYVVTGTLHGGSPIPLTMDPMTPGIFKCRAQTGWEFDQSFGAYVDFFQVSVDGDAKQVFYPEVDLGMSGELIVWGPDGRSSTNSFLLRSLTAGSTVDICLDLTTKDRRKIVTWSWVESEDSTDEPRQVLDVWTQR